jgi:hypothetical protein
MKDISKKAVIKIFEFFGYKISLIEKKSNKIFSNITDPEFLTIYKMCSEFTMTSVERMYSLYLSVDYILKNNIPGDFVECGVWRGGSAMLICSMLKGRDISNRTVFLYDTFTGMPDASLFDISFDDQYASDLLKDSTKDENSNIWCIAGENDVKNNLKLTGLSFKNIVMIKGMVEETLNTKNIPHQISLLRLDTDWYESTRVELEVLFPKLSINGVLILDDYGHWKGSKKAVDEYLKKNKINILLNRIDYTGRIAIKNF